MKTRVPLFNLVFVDGYVLISMAAVALGMATEMVVFKRIVPSYVHLLLFSGTMVSYNLHRLVKNGINPLSWLSGQKLFAAIALVINALLASMALYKVGSGVTEVLIPLVIISFLYSLPVGAGYGYLALRSIPYLKVFFVGATWSVVTVILPIMIGQGASSQLTVMLLISRFILIVAVTIPFDIRDTEADAENRMLTLPVVFGKPAALKIALFLVAVFPVPVVIFAIATGSLLLAAVNIAAAIVIYRLLLCKRCWQKSLFYTLVLDGLLMIYGLAVVLIYALGIL